VRPPAPPRPLGQKTLHDPVFKRMESDDSKPTAFTKQRLGTRKATRQLTKLVIHEYAKRLKSARRRMNLVLRPAANHTLQKLRQFECPANLRLLSRLYNGASNGARTLLLAIDGDDPRKLTLFIPIDNISRARPLATHAHIERPILLEGKAPLRLIDLHGGDADIEHDTIDRFMAKRAHKALHVAEASFDKRQPTRKFRFKRPPTQDGARITINGKHGAVCRTEDRARVTTGTESAVHIDAAIARFKHVENIGQHHRNMRNIALTGFAHRAP